MDYSKLSDAELDKMVADKISNKPTQDFSRLSDTELDQMVAQKLQTQPTSKEEVDLGFFDRARYALEPIQSNKIALLEQRFGKGSVSQDKEGNVLVEGRPVNAPGFGISDIADIAGTLPEAIPEIAGGIAGGTSGVVAGAPTGPGAIATGIAGAAAGRALGGGIGSLFRQALSTAVGTPQVADFSERAKETALSSGASVLGGALGDVAMPVLRNVPVAREIFGSPAEAELKGLADYVGERPMVQEQLAKLQDIAKRQNIPEPSLAQAAGGKSIIKETELANTPLIGGKVRKRIDSQLKAIKDNLEKITGEFIDADSDIFDIGLATSNLSKNSIESQKQLAKNLYDQVDQIGANAKIGKTQFFNKYRDYAGKLGLIEPDLSPAEYDASLGLTRETFDQLQKSLFDGMDAIQKTKAPTIPFKSINALRRTVRDTADQLKATNPDAARQLFQFHDELNDTAQRSLNREAPRLADVFREANKTWADVKSKEDFLGSVIKEGMGEEKIVKRIMSDSANVKRMKDVIGEDRVKEVGVSYLKEFMNKLGKSGVGRADAVLNDIRKNKAAITEALGPDSYSNLIDNLTFLNKTNQPLTPTRESLYNLISEGGLKGAALKFTGAAKSRAELVIKESGAKTVNRTVKGANISEKLTRREKIKETISPNKKEEK